MITYRYRRELPRGAFKTWQYEYKNITADKSDLPDAPEGFKLFTITKNAGV